MVDKVIHPLFHKPVNKLPYRPYVAFFWVWKTKTSIPIEYFVCIQGCVGLGGDQVDRYKKNIWKA